MDSSTARTHCHSRLIVALAVLCCSSAVSAQQSGWYPTFDDARAAAEQSSLPVLIHFHAWYCSPCKQMDREVFSNPDVQSALRDGVAAVNVDATKETELASQYGVTGVPCDVVIYPDGKSEMLGSGKVPRATYLAMLAQISARGREIAANGINGSTNTAGTAAGTQTGATVTSTETAAKPAADDTLIGLDGFCPVKLHNRREWVAGDAAITTEYRGIRYRFAGIAERDAFLKNPSEYAPQDLGCDPVLLTDSQRAVAGSIRYGAFFDNRLYLFVTATNRDMFKQSPLKFSRIRSALKADDIEGSSFN